MLIWVRVIQALRGGGAGARGCMANHRICSDGKQIKFIGNTKLAGCRGWYACLFKSKFCSARVYELKKSAFDLGFCCFGCRKFNFEAPLFAHLSNIC